MKVCGTKTTLISVSIFELGMKNTLISVSNDALRLVLRRALSHTALWDALNEKLNFFDN